MSQCSLGEISSSRAADGVTSGQLSAVDAMSVGAAVGGKDGPAGLGAILSAAGIVQSRTRPPGHVCRLESPAGSSPFPDVQIDEADVALGPSDALVLYTDGVTEARRGDDFFARTACSGCSPTSQAARPRRSPTGSSPPWPASPMPTLTTTSRCAGVQRTGGQPPDRRTDQQPHGLARAVRPGRPVAHPNRYRDLHRPPARCPASGGRLASRRRRRGRRARGAGRAPRRRHRTPRRRPAARAR
jgi:hypothetical protein